MSTYRTISSAFWSDPKVEDDFTPEDRYFFLYLLTNRHTNLCGCYEISKRQMSKETGYHEDVIENLLYRFKNIHEIVDYDNDAKELLLVNWHKYNWSSSEKLIRGVEKSIDHIKNESFKCYVNDVLEAYKTGSKQFPSYRVSYGIDNGKYPMDTSVPVSVSVNNNNISNNISDDALNESKESKESKKQDYTKSFDEWWSAYPPRRKGSKQECRKKYLKILRENKKITPDILIRAVEEQKNCADWKKQNGQFIPAPLTWLNQGRWEDEVYIDTGQFDPQGTVKSGGGEYIITEEELRRSL